MIDDLTRAESFLLRAVLRQNGDLGLRGTAAAATFFRDA
jgi:hypothetical protein